MIMPSLFGIDDVYLMEPPSELSEVIEFSELRNWGIGVCTPEGLWGEWGR